MAKRKEQKLRGVSSIERNGVVYWYARVDGRKTYCGKDEEGRKMAEAARHKHEGKKYERREIRAGLKVQREEFRTVKEMANWYMTLPSVQAKKGYGRKLTAVPHVLDYFGSRAVNDVEGDTQERYRQIRSQEGAASKTVDLELNLLSAMYREAAKDKKISRESIPGKFVIEADHNPRRLIKDEEFNAILQHATPDFRDFLVCGYESAMRSNEIANLRAEQVHLDETRISNGRKAVVSYLDLGIFDTKNKTRRTVPVSPALKEILDRRLQGLGAEDRVFTSERGAWSNTAVSNRFVTVCEKAGIRHGDKALNEKGERVGIVFHCLRHSRTTKWVEAGFSDEIIRRATGHRSLDAYRRYIHLDPVTVMRLVYEADKNGTKTAEGRFGQG